MLLFNLSERTLWITSWFGSRGKISIHEVAKCLKRWPMAFVFEGNSMCSFPTAYRLQREYLCV